MGLATIQSRLKNQMGEPEWPKQELAQATLDGRTKSHGRARSCKGDPKHFWMGELAGEMLLRVAVSRLTAYILQMVRMQQSITINTSP